MAAATPIPAVSRRARTPRPLISSFSTRTAAVAKDSSRPWLVRPPWAQMAPAAGGMERSDSLALLDDFLDTTELPPLMDSPFGAADDDFTGASSSTSGAPVPPEPDMGYMVKTEQPAQPPQQQMESPYYFSYPVTANGNPGGAGYSQYQATGNQQDAIRRHCKPEAPSSSKLLGLLLLGGEAEMPSLMPVSRQPSYLDLDDLCSEPLMDYSNMWKF